MNTTNFMKEDPAGNGMKYFEYNAESVFMYPAI